MCGVLFVVKVSTHNICRLSVWTKHIFVLLLLCEGAVWSQCAISATVCFIFFFYLKGLLGDEETFQPDYHSGCQNACSHCVVVCQGHCSQHCFGDSQVVSCILQYSTTYSMCGCLLVKINRLFFSVVCPVLLPHEQGFQAGDFLVSHLSGPAESS